MKLLKKRTVLGALVMSTMLAMGSVTNASTLQVNGNNITGSKITFVDSGVTMVPIRVIGEGLGLAIDFEKSTGTISLKSEYVSISMISGKNQAKVNNETVVMERPPVIKEGTTYVPLRFVGEAIGATIDYDNKTKAIVINYNDGSSTPSKPVDTPAQQGKKDVYGRAIRTTNLPKNAEWFPYIAEGVPNWAYEQQPYDDNYWGPSINTLAPKGASKTSYMPKHVYGPEGTHVANVVGNKWEELNEFLEQYLNIDYRTIDKKKYTDVMTAITDPRTMSEDYQSESALRALFDSYADHYIKDKVIIKSEFQILPETAWVTIGDQVGVVNFSAYVKMLPTQVAEGMVFDIPGSIQVYNTGVKKSSIKKGQELEGIVTFTLLRNSSTGEWKIHYSSMNALNQLNPPTDLLNGVAPGKKDPVAKDKKFNYTWIKDKTKFYSRYDRSVKSSNSYE